MAVTVKDVAKHAGVSTATVSRVINNDVRISDVTRAKVLESMEELDYKVNNIARSLKTNKTYTIGFICPELSNTFNMTLAKGMEDELRRFGYNVIICNSNENADEENERIRVLIQKCIDGVIIIPASNNGSHFKQLSDTGIPVVLADRLVDDFITDAVLVDNINASYSAMEYLIRQGVRRIGYIGGDLKITPARERDEGYRRALNDYCIPFESSIVKYGDFHARSGYEKMEELMKDENPPGYVFITNYYMHAGATKYLMEHRKDVKNPVTIASFDDMELASLLGYCKVLVSQPMLEIGSRAAKILMDRINGEDISFPMIYRLKAGLLFK
ncbi:MAG: LacI family transcriptional regulator [Ruminiclostridium sp.]|nr:LacI family transcriptional regulator [Ruminiclostridium sp.]